MVKNSTYLALGVLLISLTGWAVTPTELHGTAGPDHRAKFVMRQNYQAAYRAILAAFVTQKL